MATRSKKKGASELGFEAQLWAADQVWGHMDASDYKHVCLGPIFLQSIQFVKVIPDALSANLILVNPTFSMID